MYGNSLRAGVRSGDLLARDAGGAYRIEYRSALTDNLWRELDTRYGVTGDGSIVRYVDRISLQEPRCYYRMVVADGNSAMGSSALQTELSYPSD